MNPMLADLLQLLDLERLEDNLFRGASRDIGSPQVFGGQVLGQALRAASATVADRLPHSLHAYFLLPGDINAPIIYEVDRSRDGSSFCSRRVVAIQHGQQIFHMSASFQLEQPGLDHQFAMPDVPPPQQLQDWKEVMRARTDPLPANLARRMARPYPLEFRIVPSDASGREYGTYARQVWFKTVDRLPDDELLHRSVLAYSSDYYLLGVTLVPHGIELFSDAVRVATIDHAMWFHRPVRADEWLLYAMDSPSTSGARGLARGSIFDHAGRLVASTAQEGLIRRKQPAGG